MSCVVVTLLAQQRGAHSARCCVRIGGTRVQQRAAVSGCVVPQRNPRRRFNGPDMNAAYRTGGARLRRYRAIIDDRTARGWICCSGAASSVGTGGTRHSGGHGAPSATRAWGMGSSGALCSPAVGVAARGCTHTSKAVRGGAFHRLRHFLACGSHAMLANSCARGSGGAAWRKERDRLATNNKAAAAFSHSLTFTPACRPPSRRR